MFHQILLLEVGRYRHKEMLRNNEVERFYRQLMQTSLVSFSKMFWMAITESR